MSACQNGAGAKKGRKKLYECQVGWSLYFTLNNKTLRYSDLKVKVMVF